MDAAMKVHPFYWAVGPRGYQPFYDENLLTADVVKAVLTRGGIGRVSVRKTFDEAFGVFDLGDILSGQMVFARYQVTQDGRGDTITRIYWITDWHSFDQTGHNYEQVFQEMRRIQAARYDQFDHAAFPINFKKPALLQSRANQDLLFAAVEKFTDVVVGLLSGYRFVVVGIDDLSEQIELVETLRQLLPQRLGREISFLTGAPELQGTSSSLVFATLQPTDQMGRILRQKGRSLAEFEVFPPRSESTALCKDCYARRFRGIIQDTINAFDKSHLCNDTLPRIRQLDLPTAQLMRPDSFIPEIDWTTSVDIFKERYKRGNTKIDELLYHIQVFGGRLQRSDVQKYLFDVFVQYAHNRLNSVELEFFDQVLSAPPVSDHEIMLIAGDVTASEEISVIEIYRVLERVYKRRPLSQPMGNRDYDEQLSGMAARLLMVSILHRPGQSLFRMLSPFAEVLQPSQCGAVIAQSKSEVGVNWCNEWLGQQLVDWAKHTSQMTCSQSQESLYRTQVEIACGACVCVARHNLAVALDSILWLVENDIISPADAVNVLPLAISQSHSIPIPTEQPSTTVVVRLLRIALHPKFTTQISRIAEVTAAFWDILKFTGSASVFFVISGQTTQPAYNALGSCLKELCDENLFLNLFHKMLERFPADVQTLDKATLEEIVRISNPSGTSSKQYGYTESVRALVEKISKATLPRDPSVVCCLCQVALNVNRLRPYLRFTFQISDRRLRIELLLNYFRQHLNVSTQSADQQDVWLFLDSIDQKYYTSDKALLYELSKELLDEQVVIQIKRSRSFVEKLSKWLLTAMPCSGTMPGNTLSTIYDEAFWQFGFLLLRSPQQYDRVCGDWLQKLIDRNRSAQRFALELNHLWDNLDTQQRNRLKKLLTQVLYTNIGQEKKHQWLHQWEQGNQIYRELIYSYKNTILADVIVNAQDAAISGSSRYVEYLIDAIDQGADALLYIYSCWNHLTPTGYQELRADPRLRCLLTAIARQIHGAIDRSYKRSVFSLSPKSSIEINLEMLHKALRELLKKQLLSTSSPVRPPLQELAPDLFVDAMHRYLMAQRLFLLWSEDKKVLLSKAPFDRRWQRLSDSCSQILELLQQRSANQPNRALLYHICAQFLDFQ